MMPVRLDRSMAGQYLTAIFEMRPTKRKAAILEPARSQAEAVFWRLFEDNETEGKEIANEPDAKVRRSRLQEMKSRLQRSATAQLHAPIAVAAACDPVAGISSFVELQQAHLKKGDGAQKPEWPSQARNVRTNYSYSHMRAPGLFGLDSLVLASERNTMKFPSAYLPGFFAAKTSLALNLFSVRDNSLPHILFHIRTGIATDSYNLVRRQKRYKTT
jgi:hypothetical protein